ncbi:MAG TPA: helix-turn-helix transcriptional regulator [Ktedonobacteraceae bacterium]
MKRFSYRERDHTLGQIVLTLRTHIGLTQAGLGERLGVSRRVVASWEGSLSYPDTNHLKQLSELGIQLEAFHPRHEVEEVRALWRVAHQKVLLDESWR